MKKESRLCVWCEKAFMPDKSTAEDKEQYCSQYCEVSDVNFENEDAEDIEDD
jgi:hypothetical protein